MVSHSISEVFCLFTEGFAYDSSHDFFKLLHFFFVLSEGGFFILVDGYDFAVSVFFYSSIAVGTVVISVRISIVCPAFFVVA